MALPMIPPEPDGLQHRRLGRLWRDTTRFSGTPPKDGETREYLNKRSHEFVNPRHETYLTVGAWENFTLFEPDQWIPAIVELAGLEPPSEVVDCRWSYEWEQGENGRPMADVVIHYRDGRGVLGLLVIEAKNLGKTLTGDKNQNPGYYLDQDEFEEAAESRRLIYCIDEAFIPDDAAHFIGPQHRSGIITWQQLAGLQIKLAGQLPVPPLIRAFIAGSIQHQAALRGIKPTALAFEYLETERSMIEVDQALKEDRQKQPERSEQLWKLPELDVS
ncbi:hypothetical protein [Cyanobium sp. ATX 6F1]|uniref:hypothetical protein n=2 Tax=unclassified Cyanobium TaxID=2627006 RepID=UPI0020CCC6A3|nr:hypothetical protein [Cyanobium sp. ATX 6F1]MCP9915326.1 hypothetical protein [Cyanobium sp. ATX 6F1]